jgi:uncharacterized cupin superfamily protein
MTVEADITALLRTICPRTFPDVAPTVTDRPYVTYTQYGGQALVFLDNTLPSKENGEFQINVWSATRGEAKALIKQIEAAMVAAGAFSARPLAAPASDYDQDMMVYSARQDFSVWSNR